MTYEQYWYGDPLMVRAYLDAEKHRKERFNQEAWLQGVYFLRALDSVVGNVFRKKGSTAAEYPKEPIPLDKPKEDKTEDDEDKEALRAKLYMMNMKRAGQSWGKH